MEKDNKVYEAIRFWLESENITPNTLKKVERSEIKTIYSALEFWRRTDRFPVNKELLEEFKRIQESSDCRIWVNKNAKSADYQTLIKAMATCIYDLTGDSVFRDQVYQELERRQNEQVKEVKTGERINSTASGT